MHKTISLSLEKFSRYAGGAESYALSLAEALIANGWEVHLYGRSWDGFPEQAIFHPVTIPKFLPSWSQILIFAMKHKAMVKNENYDVILGFGNTIYMNVYQSHGGVHRYSTKRKCHSIRNPLLRFLKRALILFSIKDKVRNWIESAPFRLLPTPRIIAISNMVVDDMVERFKVPRKNIALIYNGVDLKKFNPSVRERFRGELRERLNLSSDAILFLFLSYTLRKKGIFPLMEAAAILNEKYSGKFKIVVVGKAPRQNLLRKVKEYGLDEVVVFHGPTKTPEMYFANADVFVLPTYYDTCSLVTMEAMACGLPVITTEYNGASGIIDTGMDGHVLRCPPSPEELAQAMAVYFPREKLQQISERAARKAQNYSQAKNHEAVLKICKGVLQQVAAEKEAQL